MVGQWTYFKSSRTIHRVVSTVSLATSLPPLFLKLNLSFEYIKINIETIRKQNLLKYGGFMFKRILDHIRYSAYDIFLGLYA
jgi:hypothetical protein